MKKYRQFKKACRFLASRIHRRCERGDLTLPPISSLASACGVSYQTMWRAVQRYKQQDALDCRPGRGITIIQGGATDSDTAELSPPSSAHANRLKWQRTRSALERDVLVGRYEPGQQLPSLKNLRDRYGVSYAPLRKALESLVEQGTIIPSRHGYRTPSYSSSRKRISRIIILCHQNSFGHMQLSINGDEFIRNLEYQCAKSNVTFTIVLVDSHKGPFRVKPLHAGKPAELQDRSDVLGYIYIAVAPDAPRGEEIQGEVHYDYLHRMRHFRESSEQVLRTLWHIRKPIAIFTHEQELSIPDYVRESRFFGIFKTGTTQLPGEHMARFLLELGHTRIAYISAFSDSPWSRKRLRGFQRVFSAAGYPHGVTPCLVQGHASFFDYYPHVERRVDIASFMALYDTWKRRNRLHESFQLDKAVENAVRWDCVDDEIARQLEPVFEDIRKDPSITAWAAANDDTAYPAFRFLRRNNIALPHHLTLVSFDDMYNALHNGITSYNFNIQSLTLCLLRHVLDTPPRRGSRRRQFTEIKGYIIERLTSGKARS